MNPVLDALRDALNRDPKNGALWIHYATLLASEGRSSDAKTALRTAIELPDSHREALLALLPLLREDGELAEALVRVEAELEKGDDAELRDELAQIVELRGEREAEPDSADEAEAGASDSTSPPQPIRSNDREPGLALAGPGEELQSDDWADQFDWGDLRVKLDDVAGLEDVKQQIRLRIIAPFENPDVFQAFGREAGGGILLYGPPGCGKTYIARATAGELGARFVSVSIHDVLDKYYGESEKLVHSLFENARRTRPTVLFFDEFDALGSSRGRGSSQFWQSLTNALLSEMDSATSNNAEILVMAATNLPWNVDVAFRRPGRFDRTLFVPPPDASSRDAILRMHLAKLPGGAQVDFSTTAKQTHLYSGADLKGVAERAAERAIERSLRAGGRVDKIGAADVKAALKSGSSTVLEWLATARNYARYSNEGGQFDELAEFLKRAKKW